MAPSASEPAKKPSQGSHFASQLIHSASKLHLMTPHNLTRIGKSTNFQDLLISVSKEANKDLRPVLDRAVRACNEGQRETRKAKKQRKVQILLRIEEIKKKHKRLIDKQKAKIAEQTREEREISFQEAKTEADAVAANLEINFVNSDVDTDVEADEEDTSSEPTKYDRQLALVRGEPLPIDANYCHIDLARLYGANRYAFDADREFEEVSTNCIIKLEPEAVRDKAVEYLRDRLETASTINPPVASEESSTEEILEVLHVLNRFSEDAMIRCAFAQILLYFSIQRQVVRNRDIPEGTHHATHLNILQALATKKAGHVSQKEITKTYKVYEKDYYAGKKWIDIVDWFGGDAIVILFIVAGVGPWYVTQKFTEYQRQCLLHISSHLHGTRALVEALGQNILRKYCRRGYLREDDFNFIEGIDVWKA